MGDHDPAHTPSRWRLGVSALLGGLAALSGFAFGMPGNGEFVPAIWLCGFAALLIAPGWPGFAALIGGATLSAAVLDLSDGSFGLVFLVVLVVAALAAHGALAASVLTRWRDRGLTAGLADVAVVGGAGLVAGTTLIFVWVASEFARNPP